MLFCTILIIAAAGARMVVAESDSVRIAAKQLSENA
jgi:hypothetical protein